MRRFRRDKRGAVTVFVTLLLIPAILVSGSAVDYARIFSARSVLQDANQLAANSVLASYNARLQDLYGLYGVMEDDPVLGGLLSQYVQTAVLGSEGSKSVLSLFYGEVAQPAVVFAPGQNLRNTDVLRRQIEEYAKYRAPVIIVNEILERLDKFKEVGEDAKAIAVKMDIDEGIDELDDIYRNLYACIQSTDGCKEEIAQVVPMVNGWLEEVRVELKAMDDDRALWEQKKRQLETDQSSGTKGPMSREELNRRQGEINDLETKFKGRQKNVGAYISGGTVHSSWMPGGLNKEGNWESGGWVEKKTVSGLEKGISQVKSAMQRYKDSLAEVVRISKEADSKKQELSRKVDELDHRLDNGCSTELRDGMRQKNSGKVPIMDQYRAMLKHNLTSLAQDYQSVGNCHIDVILEFLGMVNYGKSELWDRNPAFTLQQLKQLRNPIKQGTEFGSGEDWLYEPAHFKSVQYGQEGEWTLYPEVSSTHASFYQELEDLYANGAQDKKKKDDSQTSITKLFASVQKIIKDIQTGASLDAPGADYYTGPAGPTTQGEAFGSQGDWGKKKEAQKQVNSALKGSILNQIGDLALKAGDHILLLTYGSEMFSCYTTQLGDINMAGTKMTTETNYFFGSELELLFHGGTVEKENLASVVGTLLLVRFVFNYISSFRIQEVSQMVSAIRSALTPFIGPFALAVAELARAGIALAESALDVIRLRSGHRVTLIKDSKTWVMSASGLMQAGENLVQEISINLDIAAKDAYNDPPNKEEKTGLSYSDYLRLFLLLVNGDVLAQRVVDLISYNMTNVVYNLNADEEKMAAQPLFDMSKAHTGFTITTTAEMEMLFLSMPMAQKGVNGVIPPKTLPISATDYRGY